MLGTYDLNEVVQLDATFRDQAGALVAVSDLTVVVEMPDQTRVTYSGGSIVNPSIGEYYVRHRALQVGTHSYRWEGGGATASVVVEGSFFVRESLLESPRDWSPPTAGTVWNDSRLDFATLGYNGAPELEPVVDAAVAYVEEVTGREMDETLPVRLRPIATQAIRMRVEQTVMRSSADAVRNATTEGVRSVAAGGLSISYGSSTTQRSPDSVPNAWPALNEYLYLLMTEERREYWLGLASGQHAPSMAVTEVDWADDYGARSYYEDPGWGYGWSA